ncbi:MAG: hypothetical protein KF817_00005 [Phycisphaeraceae bacterium]|nr:hypothetical protein [Phycisphaeraceae bacterium]
MNTSALFLCALALATTAGCTSTGGTAPHQADAKVRITGDRIVRITDVRTGDVSAGTARFVDLHHTFTLHNEGAAPATFVDSAHTVNTVWSLPEYRRLPITLEPGESVAVAMRGRLYPRRTDGARFYTDLTLDSGETVRMEMIVEP